jgi:hypothetical protein
VAAVTHIDIDIDIDMEIVMEIEIEIAVDVDVGVDIVQVVFRSTIMTCWAISCFDFSTHASKKMFLVPFV